MLFRRALPTDNILHSLAQLLLRLKIKLKPAAHTLDPQNCKGQEALYLNMQLHLELEGTHRKKKSFELTRNREVIWLWFWPAD